jgi:hypothetical protein
MSRPAIIRAFLLALPLAAAAAQQPPATGPALIRLDVQPAALRLLLAELPLDVAAVTPEAGIEVIADAADLRALDARGVPWTLRTPDLSAFYAARLLQGAALAQQPPAELGAGLTPPFAQGAMGGYWTFDQVVSVLDQLHAQYPAIVGVKQAIGTTIEGRTLWAVKVSDNVGVDEAEPETRFDALHHAREPEGMQAALWFLLFLAEGYGSDPLATYLVNARETWFVPVVNPDGYVYNQTTNPAGGGLWRKNRRNNGDGNFGVDPNRNYPFQWGFDDEGSSPFTGSEIYRGTGPASEPEIAAMTAFLAARDFRTALSIHTYSDLWLLPYGYAEVDPDNLGQYLEVGAVCVEDNGYALGSVPDLLYLANGGTIDTEEGLHGTLSMSPEIGGPEDGFWPPTDRIVPLAEENLRGLQAIALAAGAWVRVLDVELLDEGDGDGSFEPGETVGLVVSLRNSGLLATAGAVTASLSASGAGASVLDGAHGFGVLASFSGADNAAAPLRIALDGGAAGAVDFTVQVTYEGWTQAVAGSFAAGTTRTLLVDDLETNFGWIAGVPGDTATTGKWVRGDPIGTTNGSQQAAPEDDATPAPGTQAYVTGNGGGSAGNDDVDNGHTTLLSPVMDLSDMGPASLGWARWYIDQTVNDDPFETSASGDGGGAWTLLESVLDQGPGWNAVTHALPGGLQTSAVRLRWVARDTPNNSLAEAGVDDLVVRVVDARARALVWGAPELGGTLSFNVAGEPGSAVAWLLSALPGNLQIPGIQQPLLLDVGTLFPFLSGTVPSGGLLAVPLGLPTDGVLAGVTVYFQAYVKLGASKQLTNRQVVTLVP